jgi:hypothetical protein
MATSTKKRTKRTPKKRRDWRPGFLKAFETCGMVTEACRMAKVSKANVYDERQRNEDFALAWADVEERSTELLETEAVRRATKGSDVLLIFLLKSRRPTTYRDNVKVEHGGQIEVKGDVEKEIDALLAKLDPVGSTASSS